MLQCSLRPVLTSWAASLPAGHHHPQEAHLDNPTALDDPGGEATLTRQRLPTAGHSSSSSTAQSRLGPRQETVTLQRRG